ncbi:MAG: histone-like protein [Planctomycetota bacterium]|jgi:histone H3/H4
MALPKAVVKRILTDSADGLRVSGPALDLAVVAAEEYLGRLADAAKASADENKRKTLMDADITNARAKVG